MQSIGSILDKTLKITIVAGARPNFIKISPIIKALVNAQNDGHHIDYRLVHTGQHYDKNMSDAFFEELGIPEPNVNLAAGGGTQAEQTAAIMIKFEVDIANNIPDVVLVVGDVNSTMACAIVSKKLGIPVVHVEAGIRSGDMTMPEEINRIVTDSICDHFFTTSEVANRHLIESGISGGRIHFVGNTMIDTLYQNLTRLRQPELWLRYKLSDKDFFLLTLHRPSNVDSAPSLENLLNVVLDNVNDAFVVFPVHPRTRKILDSIGYAHQKLIVVDPLPYLECIYLLKNAKAAITDSGGITEESTVLTVPCLTLRDSTERPETVTMGTNELVGTNPRNLVHLLKKLNDGQWKSSEIPPKWDGNSAPRIIAKLIEIYQKNL